ncbi:MAG TPA: TonB family protein [Stellaceae bacterium]|nr:TonB family protein [Stellaceae bacterium]
MPYAAQQPSYGRFAGMGLVALLHVALVYALVTGLARRAVEVGPVPIEAKIIEETQKERIEPPPPPPTFQPPPPPFVPPPEVHIEVPPPAPAQSMAITNVTPVRPPEPAPPPHQAVSVLPRINPVASREPEYPPVSRRLGEQGTVILDVLVDENGRAADAKLVQSCGFPRLDEAALNGVKANYRFTPGTVDGRPQPMRYTFKFTWKLR